MLDVTPGEAFLSSTQPPKGGLFFAFLLLFCCCYFLYDSTNKIVVFIVLKFRNENIKKPNISDMFEMIKFYFIHLDFQVQFRASYATTIFEKRISNPPSPPKKKKGIHERYSIVRFLLLKLSIERFSIEKIKVITGENQKEGKYL